MSSILFLIPLSLVLGAAGLATFFWTMRAGQYDDLDGAAERVLYDDEEEEDGDDAPPQTP